MKKRTKDRIIKLIEQSRDDLVRVEDLDCELSDTIEDLTYDFNDRVRLAERAIEKKKGKIFDKIETRLSVIENLIQKEKE